MQVKINIINIGSKWIISTIISNHTVIKWKKTRKD